MKIDDMLCEMLDIVNDTEAEMLDKTLAELKNKKLQRRTEKLTLKVQKKLAMDKIYAQAHREGTLKFRYPGKRRIVLLMVVFIMALGVAVSAKENDWDIQMAEMLGLSGVMEEMEGGYIKIDVSDTSDGITVTASQAIGDQNSQWLQLDTDVLWEVGTDGYYLFETVDEYYLDKKGMQISSAGEFYSFNNNGYVSFISYRTDTEKINRAKVEISAKMLYAYENEEDEQGTLISSGKWELSWKNFYSANTITRHPYKKVTIKGEQNGEFDCIIHKIEISPISIRLAAWKNPLSKSMEKCYLEIDSITLKDGTVLFCPVSVAGNHGNWDLESFLSFQDIGQISINNIDYITVGGEKIEISKSE